MRKTKGVPDLFGSDYDESGRKSGYPVPESSVAGIIVLTWKGILPEMDLTA